MSGRHLIILTCLIAALLLGRAAAHADCPLASQLRTCQAPSFVGYQDSTYSFFTPAARESTTRCWTCPYTGNNCEGYPIGPAQTVQFDIPAGVVYASILADDYQFPHGLGATSRDRYWIIGPASADPIPCTARFEVGGYGPCRSAGAASMTVEAHTVSASYHNDLTLGPCNQPPPISGALTWPVSTPVGQTFDMTLSAQITMPPQYGRAYVYGVLSFPDLPPGYSVVSCNGFGGLATPTVPRSWGSVKAHYR